VIKAILLAAGESKRFGNKNKLLTKYKKKFLINYSIVSLIKSKIDKIIIVLGHEKNKVKKIVPKNKKITFVENKNFKKGISSSIKTGLKKISKKDKGFLIVQSDMPYIKYSNLNKICKSIINKNHLVHVLKFKNKIGNPIGFNISVLNKFKKIKGDVGAKYLVSRLKQSTSFIKIKSGKEFSDFDQLSDFRK
tara:strand:- start:6526 stop:7101 length:576 start_codon:yes stop_codon:yes gene_type:complete